MLGYDVVVGGGRLMVNDKESRRLRDIFALFAEHQSLSMVVAELARRRWKTKSWTSQNGRAHPGREFAKASLRRLLTNAIICRQGGTPRYDIPRGAARDR